MRVARARFNKNNNNNARRGAQPEEGGGGRARGVEETRGAGEEVRGWKR